MKISMHAMTHDVFKKSLTQLLHVMEKGVANAKARNFDPNVLANSRLAPDMFTFAKQIQLTSDFAKNSMARLAGIEAPKYEDTESTMDELVARVKKTIDYIDTIPASALEGSETRDIRIPLRAAAEGKEAVTMNVGVFINNVISFLIVAWAVFMLVKGINMLRARFEKEKAAAPPPPPPPSEQYLKEIRDALVKK